MIGGHSCSTARSSVSAFWDKEPDENNNNVILRAKGQARGACWGVHIQRDASRYSASLSRYSPSLCLNILRFHFSCFVFGSTAPVIA